MNDEHDINLQPILGAEEERFELILPTLIQSMHKANEDIKLPINVAALGNIPCIAEFCVGFISKLKSRHLIGVQPMTEPVYKAAMMEYLPDTDTLHVGGHKVGAGTRKTNIAFSDTLLDMMTIHGSDTVLHTMSRTIGGDLAGEFDYMIFNEIKQKAIQQTILRNDFSNPKYLKLKLNQWREAVSASTHRGNANVLMLSVDMLPFIQDIDGFEYYKAVDGVANDAVGTLFDGNLSVYVDDFLPTDSVILGYANATSELDVGYVLCPYVLGLFVAYTPTSAVDLATGSVEKLHEKFHLSAVTRFSKYHSDYPDGIPHYLNIVIQ